MREAQRHEWPQLHFAEWAETCATLHLWTQVVGKVRLAKTPWLNHSWHVPLYVTSCGLMTSAMPDGERSAQIRRITSTPRMTPSTNANATTAHLQPESFASRQEICGTRIQ